MFDFNHFFFFTLIQEHDSNFFYNRNCLGTPFIEAKKNNVSNC